MTTATILLAPSNRMRDFYSKDFEKIAQQLYNDFMYEAVVNINVPLTGVDAAEEMFDLTNNPNRQEEREQIYGRHRSLSVGDIVIVEGVPFLCASAGWKTLKDGA